MRPDWQISKGKGSGFPKKKKKKYILFFKGLKKIVLLDIAIIFLSR